MVCRIAATCVLLLAFSRAPQAAIDWPALAKTLSASVVFVQGDGGCTGFVIHADAKHDKDLILTAAHCHRPGKELYADGNAARIVFRDEKKDLMILEVDNLDRPAATIATANPRQGEEVGSFGHGYALEEPMFRHAYVSNARINVPEITGGPFVMIDAAYVPGQSGGPCINAKGEVASIVQHASDRVGIGIGAEAIRDRIGRFLPKPKP
jgi:S1-C subfamily serine protease